MKPPFTMSASRGAQARRPGGRVITGRASYVWLHGVLVPAALGATGIEIRRRSPDGPWHKITMGEDEAWAEIQSGYPLQPGLRAAMEKHRAKRGLG